jgi:hypothetical protein
MDRATPQTENTGRFRPKCTYWRAVAHRDKAAAYEALSCLAAGHPVAGRRTSTVRTSPMRPSAACTCGREPRLSDLAGARRPTLRAPRRPLAGSKGNESKRWPQRRANNHSRDQGAQPCARAASGGLAGPQRPEMAGMVWDGFSERETGRQRTVRTSCLETARARRPTWRLSVPVQRQSDSVLTNSDGE